MKKNTFVVNIRKKRLNSWKVRSFSVFKTVLMSRTAMLQYRLFLKSILFYEFVQLFYVYCKTDRMEMKLIGFGFFPEGSVRGVWGDFFEQFKKYRFQNYRLLNEVNSGLKKIIGNFTYMYYLVVIILTLGSE